MQLPTTTAQQGAIRLDLLPPRACATVERIDASNDDIDRLKSMGVCVGRKVELIQPGDPMILRVFGSRIGVSARLAQCMYAVICDGGHCPLSN